jgi:predicted secreted protein
MILPGKNLIIDYNGEVIAGAKACTVKVDVGSQEVSSPTDGDWVHSIAGRKSWSISTSHILPMNANVAYKMIAQSAAFDGATLGPTFITIPQASRTIEVTGRGVTFVLFNSDWTVDNQYTFDTYDSPDVMDDFDEFLSESVAGTHKTWAIITRDAFSMKQTVANDLKQYLMIDDVPVVSMSRTAWAAVGVEGYQGVSRFQHGDGSTVFATLYLNNSVTPITATPLRDSVKRVGQMMILTVTVEGLSADRLSGTALCTSFQAQGSTGALLQGSYSWKGSGPLE